LRTVRRALAKDIPALTALDTVAAFNPERRESIAAWVLAAECHVACDDGAPVGYAVVTRSFFHSLFLKMLMVADGARRTGVGTALVEHCIGLVPAGEKLWTSTNQSNLPMQRLLSGAGFIRSGIVENMDEGDPELIYVRLPDAL
jgi:ribosomal protein S18 acetylase RimI-like enzyme